jgi:hypothetical protein
MQRCDRDEGEKSDEDQVELQQEEEEPFEEEEQEPLEDEQEDEEEPEDEQEDDVEEEEGEVEEEFFEESTAKKRKAPKASSKASKRQRSTAQPRPKRTGQQIVGFARTAGKCIGKIVKTAGQTNTKFQDMHIYAKGSFPVNVNGNWIDKVVKRGDQITFSEGVKKKVEKRLFVASLEVQDLNSDRFSVYTLLVLINFDPELNDGDFL